MAPCSSSSACVLQITQFTVLPFAVHPASRLRVAPAAGRNSSCLAASKMAISSQESFQDQSSITPTSTFTTRHDSEGTSENLRQSFSFLASMVAVGACALIGYSVPLLEAASAEEVVVAESGPTFQRTCAGCHAGGGNVLQPNATLFAKDLDRNGFANVDDIFQVTYSGKGRMPGYGEKCTPRGQCTFGPRLNDADIRALAEFVRQQADQGWPK